MSERYNLTSERPNLVSERSDLRSEKPDLGSKRLDFGAGGLDLRSEGTCVRGGQREIETERKRPMWNHRSSAPPGPLPKNVVFFLRRSEGISHVFGNDLFVDCNSMWFPPDLFWPPFAGEMFCRASDSAPD